MLWQVQIEVAGKWENFPYTRLNFQVGSFASTPLDVLGMDTLMEAEGFIKAEFNPTVVQKWSFWVNPANVDIGNRVRIQSRTDNSKSWKTRWAGRLENPYFEQVRGGVIYRIKAIGNLQWLARNNNDRFFTFDNLETIRTGAAIQHILEQVPFTSADWSINAGRIQIRTAAMAQAGELGIGSEGNRVNVVDVIDQITRAEAGYLTDGSDGRIYFLDHGYRTRNQSASTSAVIDASYRPQSGSIAPIAIRQNGELADSIFNDFNNEIGKWLLGGETTIAFLADKDSEDDNVPKSIPVTSNRTLVRRVSLPSNRNVDPDLTRVNDWGTPVVEANTLASGNGSDISSNVSVTIVTASFTEAIIEIKSTRTGHITKLGIVGRPMALREGEDLVRPNDSASIAKYTRRSYPFPLRIIANQESAVDNANYLLSRHKNPSPLVLVEMAPLSPDQKQFCQDIDIMDIVGLRGDEVGINARSGASIIPRKSFCTFMEVTVEGDEQIMELKFADVEADGSFLG